MNFEGIIGNDKIKKELLENVKNGNISHSYIFVGQEGIGKRKIAIEFAKMILCLSEDNKACDICNSCIKFKSNNNPEFTILEPDGNSLKIAQIRNIQEKIYEKPIISNKKVIIIDDSDKMTEEAQNSLLKTLEEPPEYIVIILITSNENKLLNTIKSRCLKISFNNIPNEEIVKYISNNQIMDRPSTNILRLCNGSLGKLIKINESLEEYKQIEKITETMIYGRIRNIVEMFNQFESLYKSKEIVENLLDYMEVIIYNYIKEQQDFRKKFLNLISIIENTKTKLTSNCNYDMCIDELLLKIWGELDENNSRS